LSFGFSEDRLIKIKSQTVGTVFARPTAWHVNRDVGCRDGSVAFGEFNIPHPRVQRRGRVCISSVGAEFLKYVFRLAIVMCSPLLSDSRNPT
jgi:hypothetical protein